MHPICPCLAPGEPITQIGLYGHMMEATPVHVLGNPIGNRNIAISQYPNYATSFNYIDMVCLDSISTRCWYFDVQQSYGIEKYRIEYANARRISDI